MDQTPSIPAQADLGGRSQQGSFQALRGVVLGPSPVVVGAGVGPILLPGVRRDQIAQDFDHPLAWGGTPAGGFDKAGERPVETDQTMIGTIEGHPLVQVVEYIY